MFTIDNINNAIRKINLNITLIREKIFCNIPEDGMGSTIYEALDGEWYFIVYDCNKTCYHIRGIYKIEDKGLPFEYDPKGVDHINLEECFECFESEGPIVAVFNKQKKNPVCNIDDLDIVFEYNSIQNRPDFTDVKWKANHYRIILTRNFVSEVFYYSMGIALDHPPVKEDVLNSLINDWYAISNGFEEFVINYGYNDDAILANRTYKSCVKIGEQLENLFPEYNLIDLYYLFTEPERMYEYQ